ncbi:FAD-dependent oxidoreductase [Streptomyces sp. SudanB66_2053]|uniref:FAD-dependent oxidoreductase n=1 Tax=Streptomyces sp. SudanB66_2053 TaxID=3035277 RepID=UPI003F5553BA
MTRRRVVVAGMGDTGLLTAIRLAKHADVVGVSSKPGMVSGRDIGTRISAPQRWAEQYWIAFDRFKGLDQVRTVHGVLVGADPAAKHISVRTSDGTVRTEGFDVLVVATGVTNGFWRRPHLQTAAEVDVELRATHAQFAAAASVAVVGGGAAAVGSAVNLALTWPDKRVSLFYPRDRLLTSYHPKVAERARSKLTELGVALHPGHRAVVPGGLSDARITTEPVHWKTGQPATSADMVLWTVGLTRPNTQWLPAKVLDANGFVRVSPTLQVPGHDEIFAVGDVAATDALRGSARNFGDALVARNIRSFLDSKPLRRYRPRARAHGSVFGTLPDGLEVFYRNGRSLRVPPWVARRILEGLIVRRGFYRGLRAPAPSGTKPEPGP